MRAIEWEAEMSVGLAQLDDDHKGLIAIINRLEAVREAGGPEASAEIARALVALGRYVERHFGREEAVLDAVGYRDLTDHRRKHADFVTELHGLAVAFEARRDPALAEDLVRFLTGWLIHHILIEDMAYRPLVTGNPTARQAAERYTGRALSRSDRVHSS
jgi:hemerythrin-like metal-binding protein